MADLRRCALLMVLGGLLTACGPQSTVSPSQTAVSAITVPGPTFDSTPSAHARGPIYLALGDSTPVWNGNNSYPNHIASYYAASIPGLELVNLAQSGATTTSMLHGPMGGAGSQQQQAVRFLYAHQTTTVLITIDIGGNDLLSCVSGISVNIACIQRGERTMVTNLDTIMSGLRQAAGPSARIVGMTYYNPFLGDWLAGGAARTAVALSVSLVTELNGLLSDAYQQVSAQVADVQDAFHSTDLSTMVASRFGEIPIAVEQACALLDITCQAGQLEGFGDDPNFSGAEVIAKAFENTIGPLQPPG